MTVFWAIFASVASLIFGFLWLDAQAVATYWRTLWRLAEEENRTLRGLNGLNETKGR